MEDKFLIEAHMLDVFKNVLVKMWSRLRLAFD